MKIEIDNIKWCSLTELKVLKLLIEDSIMEKKNEGTE
jgi:hypothetical protein